MFVVAVVLVMMLEPPVVHVMESFLPQRLSSLTLPSDRFVAPSIAAKYDFDVPRYEGIDQVVEVATSEEKL